MVSKKFWDKQTLDFVKLMHSITEKECVKVLDKTFYVLPNVFSPVYSSDTAWFAKKLSPLFKGKKFLEIGSGSGVIACIAAMQGATEVVATDINPEAVKNTILNAQIHSLDIKVHEGSLFSPFSIEEKFDMIFWNHPFNYGENESDDLVTQAVFDTKYQYLKEFFKKGKQHLTKNGKLFLGSGIMAKIQLIKQFAKDNGLSMKLLDKETTPVFKGKKTLMDVRLYELSPIN